jgi:hypothetical protein
MGQSICKSFLIKYFGIQSQELINAKLGGSHRNPSYLGSEDQDCGLRLTWEKC